MGHSFDIERSDKTESGFVPAEVDSSVQAPLFGELRLMGFVDLFKFYPDVHLTIVGGTEARYKDSSQPVNRAHAIMQMLVVDYGVDPNRVDWLESKPNSVGNVEAIKAQGRAIEAGVTSHYHVPRCQEDYRANGMEIPCLAAEAFSMAVGRYKPQEEGMNDKERDEIARETLAERLGGCQLADRCAWEIKGLGDKLNKQFVSGAQR